MGNLHPTDMPGRIIGAIILAICAFFGFAPEDWVTGLLPLPWSDTALVLARVTFLVIGGGAVVFLWQSFHPPGSGEPETARRHVGAEHDQRDEKPAHEDFRAQPPAQAHADPHAGERREERRE
jgi:hypothetical protein